MKKQPFENPASAKFEQQLKESQELNGELRIELTKFRGLAAEREKQVASIREQFDDLKVRLQAAEIANQFMRGYLSRVQEDDVVREELITTGDPDGEQRMIPKRKPTGFPRPDDFAEPRRPTDMGGYVSYEDRNRKAKHWITY